jgi:hypothetical protein
MPKKSFQIQIGQSERSKLLNRIEQDFLNDKATHMTWAKRCAGWLQKWEARIGPARVGDEDKPNHVVPLVQWQCFNKLARDLQSLLGDDAEITAKASGPTDQARVRKVGRYMTSRMFEQMEIINPLCEFEFRRVLNGWTAAYRPWWRREFDTLENNERKRVCDYEGPGFFPLEPDDLMIPPERGPKSLQEFSHVIRRVPVTVDDLVRGDGTLFQGTSDPEFIKKLIDWAKQGPFNDYTMVGMDPVRDEREKSEGVDYDAYMLGRRTIWLWEWYGFWRPLKKGVRGAEEDNLEKREQFEADFVVKMIPGMREIVGVQDLLYLYPKMRKRRPFVESTLIKDGTYRPKGFGALLEDIEDDLTKNSQLFQAAGELSVWPIVFYKPGGAMNPGIFKLEPGTAYATEDPTSVNVITIKPNLEFAIARQQDLITVAERVTNINDQSMGRSMSQPNAPKTATGQLALIEEGNVRAYLDSTILREDTEKIVADFWDLDCDLVPKTQPGLFFRVTKEQAGGLFDVKQGGAYMTPMEFGGKYDFKLKFATSIWARQAKKAEFFAFYQAAMMNPLVAQNPKALWVMLNRLAQECGIDDFENIVPQPPDLDAPKDPEQEWAEMLEGDVVHPNPQDNDQLHLLNHQRDLEDAKKDPYPDKQAIGLMIHHILETHEQLRTKQLMQSMAQQFVQHLQGPGPQQPAANPNLLQQLIQQYGGGAAASPGPPGAAAPVHQPGPATPPGEVPPPPAAVGAQQAPQPQDGML